jgi:hypothetical protein
MSWSTKWSANREKRKPHRKEDVREKVEIRGCECCPKWKAGKEGIAGFLDWVSSTG